MKTPFDTVYQYGITFDRYYVWTIGAICFKRESILQQIQIRHIFQNISKPINGIAEIIKSATEHLNILNDSIKLVAEVAGTIGNFQAEQKRGQKQHLKNLARGRYKS